MQELMIFEGKQVEVFEFQGKVLFNPRDVGECLNLEESAVRKAIGKMNENQVVKLTNSIVKDVHFRKLHNTGENFLTESGVYKLIFKSHKEEAERFQDWVTDVVLPSIRKTGSYTAPNKDVSKALAEFRGQVATLVNDIFDKKMEDVREYYKINSKSKVDISTYIKKRLGITKLILSVIIQQ